MKKIRENYIPHPKVLKTQEEIIKKRKIWCEKNREKRNAYMRMWGQKNKEHLKQWRNKYYHERLGIKSQYHRYIVSAKDRNYEISILLEDFKNIVEKPCHYCGEIEKRRGIDRVNNLIGYTKENSIGCCKVCNVMKRTLSKSDFLNHIEKIYLNNE